jgi:hypothetical protein
MLLQLAADQRITLSKANFVVCKQRLTVSFKPHCHGTETVLSLAAGRTIQIYATPPMNCNSGLLQNPVFADRPAACDRPACSVAIELVCIAAGMGCLAASAGAIWRYRSKPHGGKAGFCWLRLSVLSGSLDMGSEVDGKRKLR